MNDLTLMRKQIEAAVLQLEAARSGYDKSDVAWLELQFVEALDAYAAARSRALEMV